MNPPADTPIANRVVVAMSGGVDSSVAALLLHRQGYDVIGVTMKLYDIDEADLPEYYRGCCTIDDVEDARAVCRILGVPHYVLNVQREFRAFVIDYFQREYESGRTPHPCIACNDKIKFSFLARRARMLNASHVATGHYARIESDGSGRFALRRGVDADKDQSYVLFGMRQEQLAATLMPVGHYPKPQIRRLALDAGFPNADKPDSQDICFIPTGDYREFLRERTDEKPGEIVDAAGNLLGQHDGIQYFTVGQRRGLGLSGGPPPVRYPVGTRHPPRRRRFRGKPVPRHPLRRPRFLGVWAAPGAGNRGIGEDPLQVRRSAGNRNRRGRRRAGAIHRAAARHHPRPGRRFLPGRHGARRWSHRRP